MITLPYFAALLRTLLWVGTGDGGVVGQCWPLSFEILDLDILRCTMMHLGAFSPQGILLSYFMFTIVSVINSIPL